MMESLLVKTYVNCVKFLTEKYLLASAGNILQVYEVGTSQLSSSSAIFKSQRIHCIVVKNNKVLIYGGYNLALVDILIDNGHVLIKIISHWTAGHWVQDASFFHDDKFAVLGSSNVLYLYKKDTNKEIILEKVVNCKEKSVLYSAKILGTTWQNAILLCGTVFSQVTIWSPMLNDCNIVHRLVGHTGVIFSVTYHEKHQTICSTSDDRTLRVWQVEMDKSDNTPQNWYHAKISLIYSIFGHTARVWKNIQLNCGKIISIGEDGQLKVWLKDACVHYWNTHQNGNVWSLDYNEKSQLIVTGGGDGGICVWPLSDDKKLTEPNQIELILSKDDFPRQVVVAKDEKLLIYTNNGTIVSHIPGNSTVVLEDNRFRSYCILTISKSKRHYSAASISGDILIFEEHSDNLVCQYKPCNSKIFSCHWLDDDKMVICKNHGKLSILQFEPNENVLLELHNLTLPMCKERWLTAAVLIKSSFVCGDRDGSVHIYNIRNESLVKTHFKIHSRLGVSCIEYTRNKTLLSIGRDGFLRHWEMDQGKSSEEEKVRKDDNSDTLHHVSADKLPLEWPVHIVSTGGDTYILGFNEIHLVIWSTKEQKVIFKLKCGGGHRSWDYCLLDSHFCFSFIKQKQVFHIHIDLSKLARPAIVQSYHRDEINALRCVEVEQENLVVSGGEDNTLRISTVSDAPMVLDTKLILRSHISAIRCVNHVKVGDEVYLTSGGGRAQLKIWRLSVRKTSEIVKTGSGLDYQCKELVSHMLNGEDRKEKSWKLHSPRIHPETRYMDVSLHCECHRIYIAMACSDGYVRLFLYHVGDNAVTYIQHLNHHGKCVLKVHFAEHGTRTLLCSASTGGDVVVWSFSDFIQERKSEFPSDLINNSVISADIHVNTKCTNLSTEIENSKQVENQNFPQYSLLEAGDQKAKGLNDSKSRDRLGSQELNTCNARGRSVDPLAVYHLHQGGVNSLDSRTIGSDLYLISGGDDCSIVLTKLSADWTVKTQLRKHRAHNSQITGVKFLDDRRIVTSSVDQQIIVWTWQLEQQELVKLSQHESCIPDIHGLDLTGDGLVLVYGCGVNIVQVADGR